MDLLPSLVASDRARFSWELGNWDGGFSNMGIIPPYQVLTFLNHQGQGWVFLD